MFVPRPMAENFAKLKERIFAAVEQTDRAAFYQTLASIQAPTLTTGVGGSSVVSMFLAKVLRQKNHIMALHVSPRDLKHETFYGFENVVACSYSGGNIGVDASFDNKLNHYLLSAHQKENTIPLHYLNNDPEMSYVSLAATLIPMALILLYYCDDDLNLLKKMLEESFDFEADDSDLYELMSGRESETAALALESTMTESGIAMAIIHDKYNYCHGRTNLHRYYDSTMILFEGDRELDQLYQKELPKQYRRVIMLPRYGSDDVINDFVWTWLSYPLCRAIALKKGMDLSQVKEAEYNDLYYLFKGEI